MAEPRSILIVDDDQPTQHLLRALMQRNGYISVMASNGREAIEILRGRTDFAAIILDLMMPGVDGQAVIDFLDGESRTDPVIVCTAAGPRTTNLIDGAVVRAVVRKPFDIEHLTAVIAGIVG